MRDLNWSKTKSHIETLIMAFLCGKSREQFYP